MKKKWTWIIILCIFNFSLMGFILTHPTPNSKEATKIVKNVSTKKQENKKSFTFVGVSWCDVLVPIPKRWILQF